MIVYLFEMHPENFELQLFIIWFLLTIKKLAICLCCWLKKYIKISSKLYSLIVFIYKGNRLTNLQIDHLHDCTLHHTLYLNWKKKEGRKCFQLKFAQLLQCNFRQKKKYEKRIRRQCITFNLTHKIRKLSCNALPSFVFK